MTRSQGTAPMPDARCRRRVREFSPPTTKKHKASWQVSVAKRVQCVGCWDKPRNGRLTKIISNTVLSNMREPGIVPSPS
jgi:hypothetical protein